jgi:uncharacterized delta-60 repeat protein
VLAGQAVPGKTGADFALARYTSGGSLDTSFGSKGTQTTSFGSGNDYAQALMIQSDGKIVAAGYSTQPFGAYTQNEFALARYNSNGTLDTSFNSSGNVLTSFSASAPAGSNVDAEINGIAEQADGKIVVAGYSSLTGPGGGVFAFARYNSDGSLDSNFGTNGIVTLAPFFSAHDHANALVIQPDGKIIAVGSVRAQSVVADEWGLARLNTDGGPDPGFGSGSGGEVSLAISGTPVYGVEDDAYAVALQSDGKIVVAGSHGGSADSFALGRFNIDGSLDTTFNNTGLVTTQVGTGSDGRGLAIQRDGKYVVVGSSSLGAAAVRYLSAGPTIGSFAASQASAGGPVTFTASYITDPNPNSSITQVQFGYFDANGNKVPLGTITSSNNGAWSFTDTNLPAGNYTFYAQSEDNYGLLSDPFLLTLTVQ